MQPTAEQTLGKNSRDPVVTKGSHPYDNSDNRCCDESTGGVGERARPAATTTDGRTHVDYGWGHWRKETRCQTTPTLPAPSPDRTAGGDARWIPSAVSASRTCWHDRAVSTRGRHRRTHPTHRARRNLLSSNPVRAHVHQTRHPRLPQTRHRHRRPDRRAARDRQRRPSPATHRPRRRGVAPTRHPNAGRNAPHRLADPRSPPRRSVARQLRQRGRKPRRQPGRTQRAGHSNPICSRVGHHAPRRPRRRRPTRHGPADARTPATRATPGTQAGPANPTVAHLARRVPRPRHPALRARPLPTPRPPHRARPGPVRGRPVRHRPRLTRAR